jgi:hypothetical protein
VEASVGPGEEQAAAQERAVAVQVRVAQELAEEMQERVAPEERAAATQERAAERVGPAAAVVVEERAVAREVPAEAAAGRARRPPC